MSPYMRAYEQGIKLAQHNWHSKYANTGQGLTLDDQFMPEGNYTIDSQPMTNLVADYDFGGTSPVVPDLPEGEYEASANNDMQTAASDVETPYEDVLPTTVGAGDNYRDLFDRLRADAVMRGDASPEDFEGLDYLDMRDAMGARMLRPGDTFNQNAALDRLQNMGEFREGLRQDFGNVATSENIPVLDSTGRYADRRMLTQTQQGRNPMLVSPIQSDELLRQELSETLGDASAAPAAQPAAQPAAGTGSTLAAPAAAAPAAAEPAQAQQQEEAPKPNYFNVVKGGYGKQFRALQDQFKQRGQEDALEGFNYRDMAQAMGNRGLRQNDRFDANALLQRMRNIQDQGTGVMEGTQFNVQRQQGRGKERGYKDIGNFQTLQKQRAAGQQRQQQQQQQVRARQDFTANTTGQGPLTSPTAPQFNQGSIGNRLNLPKANPYSTKSPSRPQGQGYTRFGPGGGASAPNRPFNQYPD